MPGPKIITPANAWVAHKPVEVIASTLRGPAPQRRGKVPQRSSSELDEAAQNLDEAAQNLDERSLRTLNEAAQNPRTKQLRTLDEAAHEPQRSSSEPQRSSSEPRRSSSEPQQSAKLLQPLRSDQFISPSKTSKPTRLNTSPPITSMTRANPTEGCDQFDSRVFISMAVSASTLFRIAISSPMITMQKPRIGRGIICSSSLPGWD